MRLVGSKALDVLNSHAVNVIVVQNGKLLNGHFE